MEEAFSGLNKKVNYTTYKKCSRCSGQGSEPGSKPITCNYCNGRGKVRSNQGFLQFNKHVLSVVDMEKLLVILVNNVEVMEKYKQKKVFQLKSQKVLMMEQE